MIIRSIKGTNEKFAIQNEIQNLKNFYRKIKDSLRNTYKNWKNRYGRSYQGKDVTRSTMFWTAEKQFFPETLGKIYTHPTCFVRFILLANYKDSSSNTADSIEQYNNYWKELAEDPDFRVTMGGISPYALKDSDGFQYALRKDIHSIYIKIRVKDLDKFFEQDDGNHKPLLPKSVLCVPGETYLQMVKCGTKEMGTSVRRVQQQQYSVHRNKQTPLPVTRHCVEILSEEFRKRVLPDGSHSRSS